jgi:tRNA pseudouridine38-40 synthase
MRAARTDKGVHAAGMVINIKIITGIENLVEKLNEVLPSQIRVIGNFYKRFLYKIN